MHSSKPLYKPFNIVTTSKGVEDEQIFVKLTISENNTVAISNSLGGTELPSFSSFATYLQLMRLCKTYMKTKTLVVKTYEISKIRKNFTVEVIATVIYQLDYSPLQAMQFGQRLTSPNLSHTVPLLTSFDQPNCLFWI